MSPSSLIPREDGTRKLAGLFGAEARAEGDTTADTFFYYIPGTVSGGCVPAPAGLPGLRWCGLCMAASVCPCLLSSGSCGSARGWGPGGIKSRTR